jgi:hypothetical protein
MPILPCNSCLTPIDIAAMQSSRSITSHSRRPSNHIIRRIRRQDMILHRPVSLSEFTLRRSFTDIAAPNSSNHRASRNVQAEHRSIEQRKRQQRLVKRNLVARIVYPSESKVGGLLDLPVHDAIGCGDVGIAGSGETRSTDFFSDNFAAEPVAVVVFSKVLAVVRKL